MIRRRVGGIPNASPIPERTPATHLLFWFLRIACCLTDSRTMPTAFWTSPALRCVWANIRNKWICGEWSERREKRVIFDMLRGESSRGQKDPLEPCDDSLATYLLNNLYLCPPSRTRKMMERVAHSCTLCSLRVSPRFFWCTC